MMKHKLLVTFILIMFLIPAMALAKADRISAAKMMPADEANTVIVPIHVENTQELAALDIPLEWSDGATLESVTFTDRVNHMQFKHAAIDNENNRVIIGMVSMVETEGPDLTVGDGVVAELKFRLDSGIDEINIKDFTTDMPNHSLTYYYNDYSGGQPQVKEIKPQLDFALSGIAGSNLPTAYAVSQNYPNPFNPETTILYALPEAGDVTVAVYNVVGQKVRTLVDEHQEAGEHHVVWDGKDAHGSQVASGVYFYRTQLNDFSETRKMVLLK
ncbi:MAG: FlgD immunoglobulin-like domain containing protein [Candidatus Zixiibacteriota bacterium]